jgi:hypothetical protein
VVAIFPILGESAASVEPSDRALDDPALGFDDKACGVIGAFDDFEHQAADCVGNAVLEQRPSVGAVGEQFAQERELSEQSGQQCNATITVLHVSGGHQRVQHQTQCVDQDMALLALDQLAGIEAVRVDGRAPFSALFTLWLSMMQAVGLASRPACSRHST